MIDTLGALMREMVDGPGPDSVKVLRNKDGTPRSFVIDAETYAQLVRPQTNGPSLFSVGDVTQALESMREETASEQEGRRVDRELLESVPRRAAQAKAKR